MNQTDPKAVSRPRAAVAENPSILGQGSARVVVLMLVGLPIMIWGVSVVSALVAASR
jgi:hypothetical protein